MGSENVLDAHHLDRLPDERGTVYAFGVPGLLSMHEPDIDGLIDTIDNAFDESRAMLYPTTHRSRITRHDGESADEIVESISERQVGDGTLVWFDRYQELTDETAAYPTGRVGDTPIAVSTVYCALGLNGEAGEVAEKVKKAMRDHDEDGIDAFEEYVDPIRDEIGDCLWYLTRIAEDMGWSLGTIAADNIEKTHGRKERGDLHGSGDERGQPTTVEGFDCPQCDSDVIEVYGDGDYECAECGFPGVGAP